MTEHYTPPTATNQPSASALMPQSDSDGSRGAPLRRLVASGLGWSLLNSMVSRGGQLVAGIVLARLLSPEEFGVFAVALVAFNIVLSVSELGVSLAIVRTPGDVSSIAPTVTTLAIASSAILAAICFAGSPWFASTLGAPEASGVLQVMSLAVLLAGPTAVPAALLQRAFRQDRKMAVDLVNFAVSTLVAIVLALRGYGAWSLAWSRVAGNAASALLLLVLAPARYGPGFNAKQARQLLAFGLPLAGSSLLVFAILNVDYMVVGSLLGPIPLGLYLLAFNLSSWPVTAFSNVVRSVSLPGFSRLVSEPEALRSGFARSLGLLMAVTIPVCALLAALGPPLVRFVYGARWAPAASALAFLALLGVFRVALELAYDFLVAVGESRAILRLQVVWLLALAPTLWLAARIDGIRGIGLGHAAVAALVVTPAYLRVLRRHGILARHLAAHLVRPLAGGALAIGVALTVRVLVPGDLLQLAVGGAIALAVYVLVVWPLLRPLVPGADRRPILAWRRWST